MLELKITDQIMILSSQITGGRKLFTGDTVVYIDAEIVIDWVGVEKDPDGGPDQAIFNVRYPGNVKLCNVPLTG